MQHVLSLTCIWAVAAAEEAARTDCSYNRFLPPSPGLHATDHNGVTLRPTCFNSSGQLQHHHVFVIGDWGGRLHKHDETQLFNRPIPANDTAGSNREFVPGPDDWAQHRVAEQMSKRAPISNPDYVLNVGDNFYWAGLEYNCGTPPFKHMESGAPAAQWLMAYEYIYKGPGLDGKQWLGVLGNHDYGGYLFKNAWDQTIGYTWACGTKGSTCRWMTPAQYWSAPVHYNGFSVDYFFVDTNVLNAFDPHQEADHNICSLKHNGKDATCGAQGPTSVFDCPKWFNRLWDKQVPWLEEQLSTSRATWQIVVTHFPPDFNMDYWSKIAIRWGIDLIVTGHRHAQEVHGTADADSFLAPTAWIVSGGGGGITSEYPPDVHGVDDMYGFMDLTLTEHTITIEAISHGGHLRKTSVVHPRNWNVPPLNPSLLTSAPTPAPAAANAFPGNGNYDSMPPGPSPRSSSGDMSAWSNARPADVAGVAGFAQATAPQREQPLSSPGGFRLVPRGTCFDGGLVPINGVGLCEAAARDLVLGDVTARDTADAFQSGAERGCYYTDGDGYPSLWVSADPRLTATSTLPLWQVVCRLPDQRADQQAYHGGPRYEGQPDPFKFV